MNDKMRLIPSIHQLMLDDRIQFIQSEYELTSVELKQVLQESLSEFRESIFAEKVSLNSKEEVMDHIYVLTKRYSDQISTPNLQQVINATGTVLHTNLGRARLSKSSLDALQQIGANYSSLEFDIKSGRRGSRHDLVESQLIHLTEAEAAMTVNNNAAAVYLILSAFAKNQEVIVSRGELVEIGGSFRVSTIMEESGAQLVEVGTTNKTHLYDYTEAITSESSMLMRVHTSNFYMKGFTSSVEREELIKTSKQEELLYYEDLGSGMIYDLKQHQIGSEPSVADVIRTGADLVSFSGDKLLGGPQAGIIVGKKEWINKLKKHPLARVLRMDKFSYAALEQTLKDYTKGSDFLRSQNPTIRDILKPASELRQEVEAKLAELNDLKMLKVYGKDIISKVGGGTLPEVELDSYGIAIKSESINSMEIQELLRSDQQPIVCRIEHEACVLDFRTLDWEEQKRCMNAIVELDKQLREELL
ncbi:L-seryl-tRNA(Sec) selenium transferase [Halalkalibacillus halophilus]|uniref:L-seryl-tRNA(Sec) selenium transferase n=1 Tax=Halalkalibacillus halophilus TaxID=392827 RepID=UPI0004080A2F|nr:L-seryl-tRNA(Sec) selenium transferase [Halalkalibacillus halophilus]